MNVNEACTRFLTHCETEKNLSALTIRAYRGDLNCFIATVGSGRELSEFSEAWIETAVQAWSAGLPSGLNAVIRLLVVVPSLLVWVLERKRPNWSHT